ncbi:MAG TPA: 2'-5' RNA ligase family protein [Nocardioidaceae bacterium]|nr:2'-5' RNA ligase family protein [Nocardioidaceae bacterium]
MALAVCLLFDDRSARAVRQLWDRLEGLGVPTLRTHTHGRHVPHLSYATLRTWELRSVTAAVGALPDGGPVRLRFDGLGTFRRGRAWLAPAVTTELLRRQERVIDAVTAADGELHQHYRPGVWTPHCTLAPRVRLAALPTLAAAVYDVLPLHVYADRGALVDASTGRIYPLPSVP